jgi:hypothetical protein
MLGLDLIAGLFLVRRPSRIACLVVTFGIVTAALAIAGLMAKALFEAFGLLCYGWFVHVPLVLSWGAIVTWRSHRWWSLIGWSAVLALLAIYVDAFWVEPQWLQVTTIRVQSDKVTRPWRAVVIADLQTDQLGDYERRVLATVQQAQPDFVLMAGDYLQIRSADYPALRRQFKAYLRQIGFSAPLGVYAVGGNSDLGNWQQMFAGADVQSCVQTRSWEVGELRLTGLSMLDSFNPSLAIPDDTRFQIVLGHGPDFALGDVQADLLVAGHTHGGQVRLPFIGPLMTLSQVPRSWASGVTRLDERRTLVVSRGIGMERMGAPRLRFLCRPELVIIEIEPITSADRSTADRAQVASEHIGR